MKRRKGKFVREREPSDNPLGIGLSKKALVMIGVGIVAVIALKMYLDKKKAAAAKGITGPVPQPDGTLPGTVRGAAAPPPNPGGTAAAPQMNGHATRFDQTGAFANGNLDSANGL